MNTHIALDTLIAVTSVAAPIITLVATIVGTILFVRYRGTIVALRETATTFERLAEAKSQEVEQLNCKIEELREEIVALKAALLERDRAIAIIRTEIVDAIKKGMNGNGRS